MPIQLLPASAAAFAPRSAPNVVLNSKVEPWLTQTLKRINRVKRPLNSVIQHQRCLTETLSGPDAIWTLCSLMVPKAVDSDLMKDDNPLVEAMFNYQFIHVEAYVVHVDMVAQSDVAFKLTQETIDTLVEYHKDIYSVDMSASFWSWPEKESQVKKLKEEFVQAVNRFVFRAPVRALEGLEEDGAGELLEGRSEDVKIAINGLFQPLLPPPPRIVDVVRPAPLLPSHASMGNNSSTNWWQGQQTLAPPQPSAMDSWRVLPSTPSPTITTCSDYQQTSWATMPSLSAPEFSLPSPAPSFSQPFCSSAADYNSPPYSTASPCYSTASLASLPLPSMLTSQCGVSAAHGGYGDFAWSYNNFAPMYAATM